MSAHTPDVPVPASEAARATLEEAANKLVTYSRIYTGDKQARRLITELRELSNTLAAPAAPTDARPEGSPYCWCIASMNSADWAFAATRDDVIENAKLMDADCIKTAPFPLHTANPAAQSVRDSATKNTDRTCPFCNYTGEVDASGSLDCTACSAATERAALNEFVKAEGRFLPPSDLHWLIHLRAFNMARKTVE